MHYVIIAGNDRKIEFSLSDSAGGVFKIHEKSGLIQLVKKLDREQTDAYTITVQAADKVRLSGNNWWVPCRFFERVEA